jgi:hypothetical protein
VLHRAPIPSQVRFGEHFNDGWMVAQKVRQRDRASALRVRQACRVVQGEQRQRNGNVGMLLLVAHILGWPFRLLPPGRLRLPHAHESVSAPRLSQFFMPGSGGRFPIGHSPSFSGGASSALIEGQRRVGRAKH